MASKGITIEAEGGANVRAAASGRVAYAAADLRGYGKTLILEHDDAYATVYARNADLLVSAGQAVTRGQPIARLGGDEPRLYFELRRDARPEDPRRYLR